MDPLTIAIALTMNMETTLLPLFGGLEIFNSFENEILVLHKIMWLEVINVFKPFLQFLKTFDENMLII